VAATIIALRHEQGSVTMAGLNRAILDRNRDVLQAFDVMVAGLALLVTAPVIGTVLSPSGSRAAPA
jgi:hypothetical protein